MEKTTLAIGLDVALSSIGVAAVLARGDAIVARVVRSQVTKKCGLSMRLAGLGAFAATLVEEAIRSPKARGAELAIGVENFARGFPYMREEMGMSVGAVRAVLYGRWEVEVVTVPVREAKLVACPGWPGFNKANWERAGRTTKFKASMPDKGSVISGLHSRFGIIARDEHQADAACIALAVARRAGHALA